MGVKIEIVLLSNSPRSLRVATAIQDEASGMTVSKLTLSEFGSDVSPSSSNFRDLAAASRFYGLTSGGINSDEFFAG